MNVKRISIILHTSDYRGDHSTDVMMAHELHEGETVEQLAKRLLTSDVHGARFADKIEIRLVQP